jgi:hypothetical protein
MPLLPSAEEVAAHRRLPRNRHQRHMHSPMVGLPALLARTTAGLRGLGARAQTRRQR